MKTSSLLVALVVALCLISAIVSAQTPPSSETQATLEAIRTKHELPALSVAIFKAGTSRKAGVGIRKQDDPTLVLQKDAFHIGSCTKPMTATLAGMLIDDGKLRWDSTIAEVLPELKGKMQAQYESVTLEQLLQNRGGVPEIPPAKAWQQAWAKKGTDVEQRRVFIEAVLVEELAAAPGSKMIYSNQGYAIAGVMIETAAGKSWEELMTERIFKPLGMTTAGFGPPGTKGKVDQPWGHKREGKINKPFQIDNPPAIAPAGLVHCSPEDFAKFGKLHLGWSNNMPPLLKPETLTRLHTPPAGGDYACGWIVVDRPWAGGKALMHNGSNGMWYAVMWLAPDKKFAVIAATNVAGDHAAKACDELAADTIQQWLK